MKQRTLTTTIEATRPNGKIKIALKLIQKQVYHLHKIHAPTVPLTPVICVISSKSWASACLNLQTRMKT